MMLSLLGPPGSGKGSLAQVLSSKLGLQVFDTGSELRRIQEQDTPLGRELKARLEAGQMADTELVMRVLTESLRERGGAQQHWLLDGFPRNREQAVRAFAMMKSGELPLTGMIVLHAPEPILRERLTSRLTCSRCGAIYNTKSVPPPSPTSCTQACGGDLVRRNDDTERGISERLRLYNKQTMPVIRSAELIGLPIYGVDASLPLEEVHGPVLTAVSYWKLSGGLVPSVEKSVARESSGRLEERSRATVRTR